MKARTMTIETFKNQIPYELTKKLTERSLTIWAVIHQSVNDKGECCIDDACHISLILGKIGIELSMHGVIYHLRRMAGTGLLAAHETICRRYNFGIEKVVHGRLTVYTLPGFEPNSKKLLSFETITFK
jgi:hypothetical protein